MYVSERKHNPLVRSASGGRVLSALMLPWYLLLPPAGFGVLTTTGRKTGRRRRKCIRAIRRGERAYLVAIRPTSWLANLRADPRVRLRIRGGAFSGLARELSEDERPEAMGAYCETVNPADYMECTLHRRGRPTRAKIEELHRTWFTEGVPVVVELGA